MRFGRTEIGLKLFWRCWREDCRKNHPTGVKFPFLFVRYPFGGWFVRVLWIEARRWGTLTVYATKRTDATPLPTFTCIDGSLPIPKRQRLHD